MNRRIAIPSSVDSKSRKDKRREKKMINKPSSSDNHKSKSLSPPPNTSNSTRSTSSKPAKSSTPGTLPDIKTTVDTEDTHEIPVSYQDGYVDVLVPDNTTKHVNLSDVIVTETGYVDELSFRGPDQATVAPLVTEHAGCVAFPGHFDDTDQTHSRLHIARQSTYVDMPFRDDHDGRNSVQPSIVKNLSIIDIACRTGSNDQTKGELLVKAHPGYVQVSVRDHQHQYLECPCLIAGDTSCINTSARHEQSSTADLLVAKSAGYVGASAERVQLLDRTRLKTGSQDKLAQIDSHDATADDGVGVETDSSLSARQSSSPFSLPSSPAPTIFEISEATQCDQSAESQYQSDPGHSHTHAVKPEDEFEKVHRCILKSYTDDSDEKNSEVDFCEYDDDVILLPLCDKRRNTFKHATKMETKKRGALQRESTTFSTKPNQLLAEPAENHEDRGLTATRPFLSNGLQWAESTYTTTPNDPKRCTESSAPDYIDETAYVIRQATGMEETTTKSNDCLRDLLQRVAVLEADRKELNQTQDAQNERSERFEHAIYTKITKLKRRMMDENVTQLELKQRIEDVEQSITDMRRDMESALRLLGLNKGGSEDGGDINRRLHRLEYECFTETPLFHDEMKMAANTLPEFDRRLRVLEKFRSVIDASDPIQNRVTLLEGSVKTHARQIWEFGQHTAAFDQRLGSVDRIVKLVQAGMAKGASERASFRLSIQGVQQDVAATNPRKQPGEPTLEEKIATIVRDTTASRRGSKLQ